MTDLIIDSCSDRLSVVLSKQGEVFSYCSCDDVKQHSVVLLDTIDQCLVQSGITLKDVDCFATVVGWGSFTGIRVGLATVKALCFACNKPAKSLTIGAALAYNYSVDGYAITVTDAKQNKVYVQPFQRYVPLAEVAVVQRSDLQQVFSRYPSADILTTTDLCSSQESVRFTQDISLGLARAAAAAPLIRGQDLTAQYVQKCQAEAQKGGS